MGQSHGKVHSLVWHEKKLVQQCPQDNLQFNPRCTHMLNCGKDVKRISECIEMQGKYFEY